MQSYMYTVVVALALVAGLVVAENNLPKSVSQMEHDNLIEELYDFEGNTEPAHTKEVLNKLLEHFSIYDEDVDSLTEEEKKERKLINLLADLDTMAVWKCNRKFFGGIHSLVNSFHYSSPALHRYASDIRDRQSSFCVTFFDSHFSTHVTDLDVALELLM